jgi:hypothetical protein
MRKNLQHLRSGTIQLIHFTPSLLLIIKVITSHKKAKKYDNCFSVQVSSASLANGKKSLKIIHFSCSTQKKAAVVSRVDSFSFPKALFTRGANAIRYK